MTGSRVPLPTLSDGRVLLRASEPRDLPAIDAGMRDPDVIRWIGPPEGSAQDVLVQNKERWAQGWPTLSICELDGTCVGKVWMSRPEGDSSIGSVGYWLLPVARGRGLATMAVRLLSNWAIRELGVTKVRLTTAPEREERRPRRPDTPTINYPGQLPGCRRDLGPESGLAQRGA